jgi:hypothetical protein
MLEQDCRNTRAGKGQVEQDTQKMTLRTDIQNRWLEQEKQNRTQPEQGSKNMRDRTRWREQDKQNMTTRMDRIVRIVRIRIHQPDQDSQNWTTGTG